MKLKFGYNTIISLIFLYPILLGVIFFFGITPFAITAPYFFFLLLAFLIRVFSEPELRLGKEHLINILLLISLTLITCLNFSSVRYSMPILFAFFCLSLYLYLTVFNPLPPQNKGIILSRFLYIYLALSCGFLLLGHAHMEVGDRYIGFTGSPTTYAGILSTIYILWDLGQSKMTPKRIIIFFLAVLFVFLSKTRLVLIFIVLYPLLLFFIRYKTLNYSWVFVVFFGVLFFLYPLYDIVIERFPQLVTIRYDDARDASFGLRHFLYQLVSENFNSGSTMQMLFGRGNEMSRLLVINEIDKDLFPHNDFIRLIYDWGIVGAMLFYVFLYRISTKNIYTLMISLLYLILFYSNMVFNLFLISILIIFYWFGGEIESRNVLRAIKET